MPSFSKPKSKISTVQVTAGSGIANRMTNTSHIVPKKAKMKFMVHVLPKGSEHANDHST